MASSFVLDRETVKKNAEALQKFIKEQDLEGFYISSFDAFLNEYVPMEDCHRFYITNFSGSVAEVFVPASGRVKLYVDGRYYEQADLEVDATQVEVVKVAANEGLAASMFADIQKMGLKSIGVELERTPLTTFKKLQKICMVKGYHHELTEIISFKSMPALNPVFHEPRENRGLDTKEKLNKIFSSSDEGYFITAIDSLAWLTNCRGFHLPNLSSFLGRGLAVHDKVHVYLDPSTPIDDSAQSIAGVEFHHVTVAQMAEHLKQQQNHYKLNKLNIDPSMLNAADFNVLSDVFGQDVLQEKSGGLVRFHSIKDDEEIAVIKRCFKKGDQAIFKTIQWAKEQIICGNNISEYDLYLETTKKYEAQGSREQSFNTIAGVGPNGSIIHYGDPKKDVFIQAEDMVLLDSGGYFDGGFATDTTRTFMGGEGKPHPDYVKMYTLVLKGLLQCQNAVFPDGAKGNALDAYARKALYDHGYNYNHGTGHGVGIHVHEGGVRISPVSDLPMKEGQVVSIEPGLYMPGFAGVRLENIALVKKHPTFEGFLCFESLVYIGFEPSLIDESLLTSQEKNWLEEYESVCKQRGTSFL